MAIRLLQVAHRPVQDYLSLIHIEFASYYIAAKADKLYGKALAEDAVGRSAVAQQYLNQTIDMLLNVDKLLASHPLYRLEEWVNFARNSGTTPVSYTHLDNCRKNIVKHDR